MRFEINNRMSDGGQNQSLKYVRRGHFSFLCLIFFLTNHVAEGGNLPPDWLTVDIKSASPSPLLPGRSSFGSFGIFVFPEQRPGAERTEGPAVLQPGQAGGGDPTGVAGQGHWVGDGFHHVFLWRTVYTGRYWEPGGREWSREIHRK